MEMFQYETLFTFLTIFIIPSDPLYLKSWYVQVTVFLLNNLHPNCLTSQFKTYQASH